MTASNTKSETQSRGRGRRRRPCVLHLPFRELQPREAASQLGFTNVEALWAYLRRNQRPDGTVDLGGGNTAFRRGARSWVIRVPAKPE